MNTIMVLAMQLITEYAFYLTVFMAICAAGIALIDFYNDIIEGIEE